MKTMKTMKMTAIALCLGTMLGLGSCIGSALQALWTSLPITLLTEFVLDNDAILDIFGDSAPGTLM
jgi:hypothetical protein